MPYLREKWDVFSFGVVLFEVVCTRPVIDSSLRDANLPKWALQWQEKGRGPYLVGKIRRGTFAVRRWLQNAWPRLGSSGDIIWNLETFLYEGRLVTERCYKNWNICKSWGIDEQILV